MHSESCDSEQWKFEQATPTQVQISLYFTHLPDEKFLHVQRVRTEENLCLFHLRTLLQADRSIRLLCNITACDRCLVRLHVSW